MVCLVTAKVISSCTSLLFYKFFHTLFIIVYELSWNRAINQIALHLFPSQLDLALYLGSSASVVDFTSDTRQNVLGVCGPRVLSWDVSGWHRLKAIEFYGYCRSHRIHELVCFVSHHPLRMHNLSTAVHCLTTFVLRAWVAVIQKGIAAYARSLCINTSKYHLGLSVAWDGASPREKLLWLGYLTWTHAHNWWFILLFNRRVLQLF